MSGYLRRLATTGAAYTAASIFSKLIAVALLPLYTRYLSRPTTAPPRCSSPPSSSASIIVRLGVIEALLRFYYKEDEEPDRVVATSFASLFWFATAAALVALPFAKPISEALLAPDDPANALSLSDADLDRRSLGVDPARVPAHHLPARRARPRLLRR